MAILPEPFAREAAVIFLMVAAGDEGTEETGGLGHAAAIMDFFMILPLVGRVWEEDETDDKDADEAADEGCCC